MTQRHRRSLLLILILALTCAASPFAHAHSRQEPTARWFTGDDSDWWSIYNSPKSPQLTAEDRPLSEANVTILGVDLADRKMSDPGAPLGPSVWIRRGHGATDRGQKCYVSSEESNPTYLIFESGPQSDSSFYFFKGGSDWKGSDLCVRSALVTASIATASGIHLGQSPDAVTDILGNPNRRSATELEYAIHQRKNASDLDFESIRRANPDLSEDELKKSLAAHPHYELLEIFTARFGEHGLNYFAATAAIAVGHTRKAE